eukprot:gene57471-biopygen1852
MYIASIPRPFRVSPNDHPTFLTETMLTPKANREKTLQVMFEGLQVPALYIATSAVSSLVATGRRTGCVLESGESPGGQLPPPFRGGAQRLFQVRHSCPDAGPVYEGYLLPHAVAKRPSAGAAATDELRAPAPRNRRGRIPPRPHCRCVASSLRGRSAPPQAPGLTPWGRSQTAPPYTAHATRLATSKHLREGARKGGGGSSGDPRSWSQTTSGHLMWWWSGPWVMGGDLVVLRLRFRALERWW